MILALALTLCAAEIVSNVASFVDGVHHHSVTQRELHRALKLRLVIQHIHNGLRSASKPLQLLRHCERLDIAEWNEAEMAAPRLPHMLDALFGDVLVFDHHRIVVEAQSHRHCQIVPFLSHCHQITQSTVNTREQLLQCLQDLELLLFFLALSHSNLHLAHFIVDRFQLSIAINSRLFQLRLFRRQLLALLAVFAVLCRTLFLFLSQRSNRRCLILNALHQFVFALRQNLNLFLCAIKRVLLSDIHGLQVSFLSVDGSALFADLVGDLLVNFVLILF
mmetsp:Transcript_1569/g.2525  ORF Transcript_1569/g.2525 Transcript_1569/m.2525 type:complete len:277 (+) Transcript_1569:846-1676(+)